MRRWWHCVALAGLVLVQGPAPSAQGQVTFTDVTEQAGVGGIGNAQGCAWVDYDGDGDLDLYVANGGAGILSENFLYRNEGDGMFTDVAGELGVQAPGVISEGCVWADFDNDGLQDLFISTIGDSSDVLYRQWRPGSFADWSWIGGVREFPPRQSGRGVGWADYDRDGVLDLYVANFAFGPPGPDYLYRNNGNIAFTDVAGEAGVENPGATMGAAWGDYNGDGWPDLFVTESTAFPSDGRDFLYRNRGDGTFAEMSDPAGLVHRVFSFFSDWGDYDNDGDLDLYIGISYFGHPNLLYRNNGDGTFTDVTEEAGVPGAGERGAAGYWGDYDNDGDLDLFATGFGVPNVLYQNDGDGTFRDATAEAGVAGPPEDQTEDAAWGDYDTDGDLDLVVTNDLTPNRLYRNEVRGRHFLLVATRGRQSNRDGVGARLTVYTGSRLQMREIQGGNFHQNDPRAHFGLSDVSLVDSLVIRWPSGIVDVERDVASNQLLACIEDSGCFGLPVGISNDPPKSVPPVPRALALLPNFPNPFNPSTVIPYAVPGEQARGVPGSASGPVPVRLEIFSLRGERVRTLVDAPQEAGWHQVIWDGRDDGGRLAPSGSYFVRMSFGGRTLTRKVQLLR